MNEENAFNSPPQQSIRYVAFSTIAARLPEWIAAGVKKIVAICSFSALAMTFGGVWLQDGSLFQYILNKNI